MFKASRTPVQAGSGLAVQHPVVFEQASVAAQDLTPAAQASVAAQDLTPAAPAALLAWKDVTSAIVADTNVVREKIVRTQFTPSADQTTFAAGWHMHPGLSVVQVQEGRLTIIQNCRSTRLRPGDTFVEVPYLPVNAVASEPVEWTTTFLLADSAPGAPDRLPATDPDCASGDDEDHHEAGAH